MPRGGRRKGAGRPVGSSVLDELEIITVAAECQRRWNEDCKARLQAAQDAYYDQSDYLEKSTRVRESGGKDAEALEDVEFARREMAGTPDDEPDAPRLVQFEVSRPYRVKEKIIADVAAWASHKFHKNVSQGVVASAWDLAKEVRAEGL